MIVLYKRGRKILQQLQSRRGQSKSRGRAPHPLMKLSQNRSKQNIINTRTVTELSCLLAYFLQNLSFPQVYTYFTPIRI